MSDTFNLYRLTHPETIPDSEMDQALRFVRDNDNNIYKEYINLQMHELQKKIEELEKELEKEDKTKQLSRDDKLKASLLWQKEQSVPLKRKFLKDYFSSHPEKLQRFDPDSFLRQ